MTHLPAKAGSTRAWQSGLYGLKVGLVGGWKWEPTPDRVSPNRDLVGAGTGGMANVVEGEPPVPVPAVATGPDPREVDEERGELCPHPALPAPTRAAAAAKATIALALTGPDLLMRGPNGAARVITPIVAVLLGRLQFSSATNSADAG
jgi:hypothetical protein